MQTSANPNAGTISPETQLETTATLANAILVAKMVFGQVAGREISNLDHHESQVDDLIAANINKYIAGN